ncbi:MAG: hypothetical protein A3E82_07275 [Gammaproteobacteria bacterium RIFCSPHIGHO2_12_FULL_38_11]|nr:MAG: hypothetical protein A3E82_07275 [Gammaproteobacteria bacterium RIFCSPHIGHO2_12_FULL_38_11]
MYENPRWNPNLEFFKKYCSNIPGVSDATTMQAVRSAIKVEMVQKNSQAAFVKLIVLNRSGFFTTTETAHVDIGVMTTIQSFMAMPVSPQ